MKTQNVQTRRCAEQVDVKCLLLQQQAHKCTAIHVDAQNSGANAAIKHKAAASMRELCEEALGACLHRAVAGHHRCCVPARRLMTARTKPGRQSECAASWLDKDGNSCGRGCCFLVRAWRAVPVGRSYRCAPLRTHKSCPIPRLWSLSCLPTSVVALCQLAPALSLRCLSLESTLRRTLGSRAYETPTVSGLFQQTTALTCRPHWERQPTAADFTRSFSQHKQAKGTYVVLLRGTLQGFLPNNPRPLFSGRSAIGHQPYGARFTLKLVMGSQYPLSNFTSRFGTQTSTCTISNH